MAIGLKHGRWGLPAALGEFAADGEFDLVREIIDIFLVSSQENVESLRTAVGARDLAGAKRTAHSLKGAAAQMGIPGLAACAEKLECSAPETDEIGLASLVLAIQECWGEAKQSVIGTRDSLPGRC